MPKPNLGDNFSTVRAIATANALLKIGNGDEKPNSRTDLATRIASCSFRNVEGGASTSKSRDANYKTHEDKVLCQSWLSVSCDPIGGIYQTGDDFYKKIKVAFDDELDRQRNAVADRSPASLASRFKTISHSVSKFVGCYTLVVATCASGKSPNDIEHDAVTLYESRPKNGTFKFMPCWYVLRDSPKWGAWHASNEKKKAPKKRQHENIDSVDSENVEQALLDSVHPVDSHRELAPGGVTSPSVGAGRAKMDRANLALYARQVKAAERAVANAEKRICVAQEQLDLSLFSIPSDQSDPLITELLMLKRRAALKRIRAELQADQPRDLSDMSSAGSEGDDTRSQSSSCRSPLASSTSNTTYTSIASSPRNSTARAHLTPSIIDQQPHTSLPHAQVQSDIAVNDLRTADSHSEVELHSKMTNQVV